MAFLFFFQNKTDEWSKFRATKISLNLVIVSC